MLENGRLTLKIITIITPTIVIILPYLTVEQGVLEIKLLPIVEIAGLASESSIFDSVLTVPYCDILANSK